MDAMTSRERLVAALTSQPVDRIPWSPFLAYVWEYLPADVQQRGQLAFHHEVGADPLWRGTPCPVTQTVHGVETRADTRDGRTYYETITPVGTLRMAVAGSEMGGTTFLVEHPLKSAEDVKVQLWIEEHTEFTVDLTWVKEHFRNCGSEGLSLGMLHPRCKTAYQNFVEHHFGTEELIFALEDYPELVEELQQVTMANNLAATRLVAQTDAYDYFITWEDSSTQNYSPAQYDRYISPEIRGYCEILGACGKQYIQHACGHVKELTARMKADGVFAIESVSPPPTGNIDLRDVRAIAGSDFGIIGGIEPTHFLNLSLEELPAYVEQVIADGAGGPFVLANSDSCPPGVTVEKFAMIGRLVREVGS